MSICRGRLLRRFYLFFRLHSSPIDWNSEICWFVSVTLGFSVDTHLKIMQTMRRSMGSRRSSTLPNRYDGRDRLPCRPILPPRSHPSPNSAERGKSAAHRMPMSFPTIPICKFTRHEETSGSQRSTTLRRVRLNRNGVRFSISIQPVQKYPNDPLPNACPKWQECPYGILQAPPRKHPKCLHGFVQVVIAEPGSGALIHLVVHSKRHAPFGC